MPGPLSLFLQQDHARLEELLRRATASSEIDLESFRLFRAGLLRHIAMEEKVLLPEARRRRNGEPLPLAARLRADHATLAALLVPPPRREIIELIRGVLGQHNPLEEGHGGVYQACEQLVGREQEALIVRLRAVPEVRVAAYFDGPAAHANIERLLRARD